MITNKVRWNAIFSSFSHPCVAADVILNIDILSDILIFVMGTPVITLEFMVRVLYDGDVLVDLLLAAMTAVVPATDVVMLTHENAAGSAALITPLEVSLTAPRKGSMT